MVLNQLGAQGHFALLLDVAQKGLRAVVVACARVTFGEALCCSESLYRLAQDATLGKGQSGVGV